MYWVSCYLICRNHLLNPILHQSQKAFQIPAEQIQGLKSIRWFCLDHWCIAINESLAVRLNFLYNFICVPFLAIRWLQGNLGIISRCIKENLGFKDGKPVAACVMYKCLLHWHAFESESTAIFDFIIERINDELKVTLVILKHWNLWSCDMMIAWVNFLMLFQEGKENDVLPYWLSNTSALLCLLQRNQQSNGFLTADSQCSAGSVGPNGRLVQVS